jgi:multidrug efflux pump subunit AcrB
MSKPVHKPRTLLLVTVVPVAILTLIGLGSLSWQLGSSGQRPDLEFPSATLILTQPGATAEEMAGLITPHIDQPLSRLPRVNHVLADYENGRSTLTFFFARGVSPVSLERDLTAALARHRLPPPMSSGVALGYADLAPVVWVALRSGEGTSLDAVSRFAETDLLLKLAALPGVGTVQLVGASRPVLTVRPDVAKLDACHLSVAEVRRALEAKLAKEGPKWASGPIRPSAVRDLVVKEVAGRPVRLRDVAAIAEESERDQPARLNGEPIVALGVYPSLEGRPKGIAARVREVVGAIPAEEKIISKVIFDRVEAGKPIARRRGHTSLFTRPDADQLLIELRTPGGKEPEVEKPLSGITDIEDVLIYSGHGGPASARVWVRLTPGKRRAVAFRDLNDEIRSRLATPDVQVRILDPDALPLAPMFHTPVALMVVGEDTPTLLSVAEQMLAEMRKSPHLAEVAADYRTRPPEPVFDVDRAKCAAAGVKLADVTDTLSFLQSKEALGPFRVRMPEPGRSARALEGLSVFGNGKQIPLTSLVSVRMVTPPPVLRGYNGRRSVLISAELAGGANLPEVQNECRVMSYSVSVSVKTTASYEILFWGEDLGDGPQVLYSR